MIFSCLHIIDFAALRNTIQFIIVFFKGQLSIEMWRIYLLREMSRVRRPFCTVGQISHLGMSWEFVLRLSRKLQRIRAMPLKYL